MKNVSEYSAMVSELHSALNSLVMAGNHAAIARQNALFMAIVEEQSKVEELLKSVMRVAVQAIDS